MERIETWAVARRWAWVPAAVLLLPLMVACAAPAATHLDCPLGVSLDGRAYMPWPEQGEIPIGRTVGTAMAPATVADQEADTCDRTAPLTALAVEGVDPSVAFFAPDSPAGLYVSEDIGDVSEMPPALQRLVKSPR
jgi:hypothetical protein